MGKSAPEPPDPWETAAAQGAWNSFTAQQQQQMNMVNQNTPWGNLNYDQTGTTTITDPSGKQVQVPTYTATTELSPEQQAIFDQSQQAQGNLAGLAADQSANIRELLNDPFEFNNQDAANWAYDLGAERLDPRIAQQRQQLDESLLARGIRPGSAAYEREMGRMDQSANDAYNQLMLDGRSMAFNEALTTRNQPLNEVIGLFTGSQVQQPQFQSTPQTGVAGVDYTGLVNNQYNQQMENYRNNMGGLFGLAGTIGLGAMKYSDIRLKEDIRHVGQTKSGIPIYTYRYKGSPVTHMGVMAQDVPHARAVDPDSGFYRVDYGKVS